MVSTRSRGSLPSVGEHEPTYVQGRQRSEFVAHFASGTTVQVELGRMRRYPGLVGPAPQTHLCYRHFVEHGPRARHVIDVGCGAGTGLRWLLQATTARVVGVDGDARAIAFAREYVPDAELVRADAHLRKFETHGCAAVIVDLLGLLPDPVKILQSIASRVTNLESLFLAEPVAHCDQQLVAPARRAFSAPSLTSSLTRSGFEIDQLTQLDSGMYCVTGHLSRDPACDYLCQAEMAYFSHQTQSLLELCQLIRRSSNPLMRAEAALLEARLWFDLEKRDRAIALLSDARVLSPNDARPIAGMSRLALASGSQDQAVQLADMAARTDPTDFSVLCSVALAYAATQRSRSLLAWKAANALAPDDFLVAQMACAAAMIEGHHDEARSLVERLTLYDAKVSRLHEHVALARLVADAQQDCLSS